MAVQGWFQQKTQAWQNRRLPAIQQIKLTQKQIFIFLTKEGGLLALMMLAIFIAGVNYANNLVLGLCFFLGSTVIVTIYYTFNNLSGLLLEAIDATDSEAGGHTEYRIRLTPHGRKFPYQIQLIWDDQHQIIEHLDRPVLLSFKLLTPDRGRFLPSRLRVETVYPLGVLRAWSYVRFNLIAWVSPKPIEGILHGESAMATEEDEAVIRVAGSSEFDDLREFVPGESLSRVSWTHLARGQGTYTKQFSDAHSREQILDYKDMYGGHELRLSKLAYWVKKMTDEQVTFELKVLGRSLPLGQGLSHQAMALRLLAEIQ
ncbi:DUF58 domain-containing protein [Aquirhabdus sp.]|uniref:DUF58 domain-containing protein n=1 Tax=Aquirhabdus sp. TaxID=2824160 RepID=UPI00396C4C52